MPLDAPKSAASVAEPVKAAASVQNVAPTPEPEADPAVSVEDFCAGRSSGDKRVELIGGFAREELREGRHFDIPANFAKRLDAFANRPVKR